VEISKITDQTSEMSRTEKEILDLIHVAIPRPQESLITANNVIQFQGKLVVVCEESFL